MRAHITDFIAQHFSDDGEEIFAAYLDNGQIRIGWAGGAMKDFPAPMVETLVEELKTANDFDIAENILIDSGF